MTKMVILLLALLLLIDTHLYRPPEKLTVITPGITYHILYMSCDGQPTETSQQLYRVTLVIDRPMANSHIYKPVTCYVVKQNITLERISQTTPMINRLCWLELPTLHDGVAEQARIVITSNSRYIWDIYDNACR